MTTKIVKTLAVTFAFAAAISLGTGFAAARGGGHPGGGGGGHPGGGHVGGFSGAHGFSGARVGGFSGARMSGFSGARIGNFSGARMGAARFGGIRYGNAQFRNFSGWHARNFSSANVRNLTGGRMGAWRLAGGTHARALGVAGGALGARAAWNHWGNPNWKAGWNGNWHGWHGGWGGWAGPVYWPYFFGNLFAFTFWPYPFFDPFWAYGDWFVWDALFWPGPYYFDGPAYVYGPDYYDIYRGYAYSDSRRTRIARRAAPETTGSTSDKTALAESCGGLAPGVTELPIDRIERAIEPTGEQRKALDELRAASSQAADTLKANCSNEVPLTPLGRLDAVQKRIDGLMQTFVSMRTPLDNFYNSLNEEQKQRFAALGQDSDRQARRRGSAPGSDLAALCSRRAESFAQLPAQRIEQAVKPAQQQLDALDRLKIASADAANQLRTSCPSQLPVTPLDRFDAIGKRLQAMDQAIKTVRPALVSFYDSLTDEQKARFNTLKLPQNASSPQG